MDSSHLLADPSNGLDILLSANGNWESTPNSFDLDLIDVESVDSILAESTDLLSCLTNGDADIDVNIDSIPLEFVDLSSLETINGSQFELNQSPNLPSSPESLLFSCVGSPASSSPQPEPDDKVEEKVKLIMSKKRSLARAPVKEPEPALPDPSAEDYPKQLKLYKQRMRIIKNRESAHLSRKRKKEEQASLEARVKLYSEEHAQLKRENELLKERIQTLERENAHLRVGQSREPQQPKRPVYLMLLCFLVSVGIFTQQSSVMDRLRSRSVIESNAAVASQRFIGRGLLAYEPRKHWGQQTLNQREVFVRNAERELLLESEERKNEEITALIKLPENLMPEKMAETARKMAESFGNSKKKVNRKITPRRKKFTTDLVPVDPSRVTPTSELTVYGNRDSIDYEAFVKAINRQPDTFYVVSLKDHILLPAIHQNKTQRPKMAFMMPAVKTNESLRLQSDEVAFMKIDCEVMDTHFVSMASSIVPLLKKEDWLKDNKSVVETFH